MLPQQLADVDQVAVARGVTQRVVDQLEAVEVHQRDRGADLVPDRPRDLGLEPLLDGAAVEEPGEPVGRRRRMQPLHQLRVLERDAGRERERARQLPLGPAVGLAVDPRAQEQEGQALAAGVERHHELGTLRHQGGHADFSGCRHRRPGRQGAIERASVDHLEGGAFTERAALRRLVATLDRLEENRPPREEDLGHEVEDQVLGLFGRVHRGEQTHHLAEGTKLKGRVIERGLSVQQHTAKLERHVEPEAEVSHRRAHGFGDIRHRVEDDLGFAAAAAKEFGGVGELQRIGTDPRGPGWRGDREPDRVVAARAHQGIPAALV